MTLQQAHISPESPAAGPLVSIVLPVFNSADELQNVLSNIDEQLYRLREIIVVDDGSTDDSLGVAEKFAKNRDDVTVVHTEHLGAAHARNSGASNARGSIVFFAETDCVYDCTYTEKAVNSLVSQPDAAAVCLTGAPLITRNTLATGCIDVENKVQHRLLSEGKIKPFYAWVYRKEILKKIGGFDERLFQAEDKDLFGRLQKGNYKVAWVSGVNWRHRRDQTTRELASKWFTRARSRLLYLLKNRRIFEILKTLAPFWITVAGLVILPWDPLVGGLLLLLVGLSFVIHAARIASISWSMVQRKRIFLGYPLFVITRNFSMAMGYSLALVTALGRRIQGKEIAWNNL